MKLRQKIGVALAALWALGAVGILVWMAQADPARLPTPALDILIQIYLAFTPLMVAIQVFLHLWGRKKPKNSK